MGGEAGVDAKEREGGESGRGKWKKRRGREEWM